METYRVYVNGRIDIPKNHSAMFENNKDNAEHIAKSIIERGIERNMTTYNYNFEYYAIPMEDEN